MSSPVYLDGKRILVLLVAVFQPRIGLMYFDDSLQLCCWFCEDAFCLRGDCGAGRKNVCDAKIVRYLNMAAASADQANASSEPIRDCPMPSLAT